MAPPATIPIIDFSHRSQSREELAKEIVDALQSVGFLFLDNVVGFDREVIERATKWFYNLPESCKYALAKRNFNPQNENIYRGYFPADATSSSYKEGYEISEELSEEECSSIGFPLYEKNPWPCAGEEDTKWFKDVVYKHYQLMHNTAMEVSRLIARGFGAAEDWFDSMFSPYPLSTLRLINYPVRPQPIPDCARDGEFILHCGAHTDTPFLTLLATFDYPGLQIQNENDQWVDVPVRSNSLVLNIGDVLSKVTGSRLKATSHRVVDMGCARQSVPYFLEPRFDVDINRNIVPEGGCQEREEVHYGPWLVQNMKRKGYVEVEVCGTVYIVETGRTIVSRMKEHLTIEKQTVYTHWGSHKKFRLPVITWKILHANIANDAERKYIEAFEIQKYSGDLMNGCIGRTISV